MSETGAVTWLTQEAYDRLSAELEHLSGPARAEIARKIDEARQEGDLRENGGYHAAKDEQGKQEARIRQLTELLRTAHVGETPASGDGTITSGTVVTVELAGEKMTFLLGHREVGGEVDLDVYSEASPLGSAVLGQKVGDEVTYTAPTGRELQVKILDATPFTG